LTGFAVTEEELTQAVSDRDRRSESHRQGATSLVVKLAAAHDPPLRIDKPELARMLAVHAFEHPERDGRRRPILELAEHLLHLTWADRRLAGSLR
jgi:hypothetical protein